jgi:hypothetical protein
VLPQCWFVIHIESVLLHEISIVTLFHEDSVPLHRATPSDIGRLPCQGHGDLIDLCHESKVLLFRSSANDEV